MIYPVDDLSEGKQYYEAVMSQNAEDIDGDHIIFITMPICSLRHLTTQAFQLLSLWIRTNC